MLTEQWADELRYAYRMALGSPDPSTQNGAILIRVGLDGRDMDDWVDDWHEKGRGSIYEYMGITEAEYSAWVSSPYVKAWNDFTEGLKVTDEMYERPLKYEVLEHAERNVIYAAAREHVPTKGATIVCPWAACTDCARAIVQSGIARLVRHKQASDRSPERWVESIKLADQILLDGGVEIVDYDGFLNADPIRHCEELWRP